MLKMQKQIVFTFLMFITTFTLAPASEFKRYFINHPQNFTDFKAYSHNVAKNLKPLTVSTPDGRKKFQIMCYEFVNKIHDSVFYLNKAVVNIDNAIFCTKMDKVIEELSEMALGIQRVVHSSDYKIVNQKLEYAIEAILHICEKVLEIVTEFHDDIPPPVFNPFQIGVQRCLYAIHQLKTHIDFFNKNNEEIAKEAKTSLNAFMKAITKLTSESDELQKELLYQIIQLEHIVDKTVLSLESWAHLNTNETEKIKTVREISVEMSEMYEKLHRLGNNRHTVSYIASHFGPVYRDFHVLIKNLGQLDADGTPGNLEYIRTVLLNSVCISNLYTSELRCFSSKNEAATKA